MTENEIEGLLTALAASPATLGTLAAGLTDSALRKRTLADEFSFVETACHLRDLEREGYAERIARLLDETDPILADFDGAAIAAERDYHKQDFGVVLQEFSLARTVNLERLRELPPDQFARGGELEGTGRVTLAQLLGMMREHDQIHLGEMTGWRAQLMEQTSSFGAGS